MCTYSILDLFSVWRRGDCYLVVVDEEGELFLSEEPCLSHVHAILPIEELDHWSITVTNLSDTNTSNWWGGRITVGKMALIRRRDKRLVHNYKLHMWQSQEEIEQYSVANFDRITTFKAL